jgi:hemolysin III
VVLDPSGEGGPPSAPAPVKPRLRGVSHQIAFFVALVAGPLVVLEAPTAGARFAASVYAGGLILLFGVSASFHRVTWNAAARRRMRRLDHSTIFVFIACTYTPVVGLSLTGGLRVVLLVIVWIGALGGVLTKLLWLDAPRAVAATAYISLGWVAVVALPSLSAALGAVGMTLLVAGGVSYTLGAIVFARRRPDPVPHVFGYHEVFHAFVIVAAVLHYILIAGIVIPNAG